MCACNGCEYKYKDDTEQMEEERFTKSCNCRAETCGIKTETKGNHGDNIAHVNINKVEGPQITLYQIGKATDTDQTLGPMRTEKETRQN